MGSSWAIVRKELQDRWLSLVVYCGIALAFLTLYISLFPSLKRQAQELLRVFQSMPPAVLEVFGGDQNSFTSLERYLAVEFYSLTWPLMAVLLALTRASRGLAGEVEQGTMGSLLALPLSRTRLFWSKYAAGLLAQLLFVVCSVVAIMPLASLGGISLQGDKVGSLTLICVAFSTTVYSLGTLCSAWMSDRGRVMAVAGGGMLIMYVLNVMSKLKPEVDWLANVSLFHYFEASQTLAKGGVDGLSLGILAGVSLAATLGAWVLFARRDITV